MEVRGEPVALKVTNLGGIDVTLSRLWIIETASSESDHIYANLEPLNVLVSPGQQQIIVLSDTTEFSGESLAVAWKSDKVTVQVSMFRQLDKQ